MDGLRGEIEADPFAPYIVRALEQHGERMCSFHVSAQNLMLVAAAVQMALKEPQMRTSGSPNVELLREFVAYVANHLGELAPVFALLIKANWA